MDGAPIGDAGCCKPVALWPLTVVNRNDDKDEDFMACLEKGVRDVLGKKSSTASEKLAAVTAGTKLLAIRHRITGGEEENFFSK